MEHAHRRPPPDQDRGQPPTSSPSPSMRPAASTSRTSGRYAVGPDGPIPDTDAYPGAPTDDQKKIKNPNEQVDRPRPFRDDLQVDAVALSAVQRDSSRNRRFTEHGRCSMNEWVPLTVASITALVAIIGYLANGSINRLSERRKAYAQALADLEKLKQLPYDIRRRPDSSAESRVRVAEAISQALAVVAFHRRWLMLDSKDVGSAYNALVAKVRDANAQFRKEALEAPAATEDHLLHLDNIYRYDDRPERDACIQAMRKELGYVHSIIRSR